MATRDLLTDFPTERQTLGTWPLPGLAAWEDARAPGPMLPSGSVGHRGAHWAPLQRTPADGQLLMQPQPGRTQAHPRSATSLPPSSPPSLTGVFLFQEITRVQTRAQAVL